MLAECNLDDMTGEELGYALERVLDAGALDAWFTPVQMKKNRPGVVFSVLCRPADSASLRAVMLRETRTLGVRWQIIRRDTAERRFDNVQTPWGPVRCKLKLLDGRVHSAKPEFGDCAELARKHGIALVRVVGAAREAASRAFLGTLDHSTPTDPAQRESK